MEIRKATEEDVRQIAEIVVEDWKTAYKGIIDDDYLESLSAGQRYDREMQLYPRYMVAVDRNEVLGYVWNEMAGDDPADCEVVALYVRYSKRKSGIGRALLLDSMDRFRKAGKKTMIIWCLRENHESRRFYEKMGGQAYKDGTHRWGSREYDMISYLYQLD